MSSIETLKTLRDSILVPVLRTNSTEMADTAISCLRDAGFHTIEITMTIPNCHHLIAQWSKKDMQIGAGTILELESAERCIEAGASFVVSPINVEGLPELCHKHDVVCTLGAMTPNEVNKVLQAGCDIVKIYPANSAGGPAHIKALLDIFPDALFMPTGGIVAENMVQYMRAGAAFLGAGSSLLDFEALKKGDLEKASSRCRMYMDVINNYRKENYTCTAKK